MTLKGRITQIFEWTGMGLLGMTVFMFMTGWWLEPFLRAVGADFMYWTCAGVSGALFIFGHEAHIFTPPGARSRRLDADRH